MINKAPSIQMKTGSVMMITVGSWLTDSQLGLKQCVELKLLPDELSRQPRSAWPLDVNPTGGHLKLYLIL